MIATGQRYVGVHTGGVIKINSVNLQSGEAEIEHFIDGSKPSKQRVPIHKFQWGIDRADYILETAKGNIEPWMFDKVKKALKECFGLHNALRGVDPLIITAGIDSLHQKTGFRKNFLYSIIETIRETQV